MIQCIEIEAQQWMFNYPNEWDIANSKLDTALEYWHADKTEMAIKLLKQVLKQFPTHIDTYHHLSILFEDIGEDFEAYLCAREAVRIGLEVIPDSFNWKKSQLQWGFIANRPFLRAFHNLGLWHCRRKEIEEAIHLFSRMLAINPEDNQGIRYLLPQLWLEKRDILSVIRLCKQFQGDMAPEISYTYPLALILSGEIVKARNLLQIAKQDFPLVTKELLKKRHKKPVDSREGFITWGGADQAYQYWVLYGKFWQASDVAMSLLAEK